MAISNLLIFGTEGDDSFSPADFATVFGLGGNDLYIDFFLSLTIVEQPGGGTDTVWTPATAYTLPANVENLRFLDIGAAVTGTGNTLNNRIEGTSQDDIFDGGAGRDTMVGGDGQDLYIVDNALDVIVEAPDDGIDSVAAQTSYTLPANVELLSLANGGAFSGTGNAIDNTITGADDNNVLRGMAGGDQLIGDRGNDRLDGGDGNDFLEGGLDNDILIGGAGVDVLRGQPGNDNLAGGAGNDDLIGDAGKDTLAGGTGHDFYNLDDDVEWDDIVVEAAAQGTDTVRTGRDLYTLPANVEVLISNATGNAILTGNALNNSIYGSLNSDVLSGLAGNDFLEGGTDGSADTLRGGLGNDTYSILDSADTVVELAGQGTDTVLSQTSYALPDNVENLTLLAFAGALNGWGNGLNNRLTGNESSNRLEGMGGNDTLDDGPFGPTPDTLVGGTGNDLYLIDSAVDQIVELAGEGMDSAVLTLDGGGLYRMMPPNLENLQIISSAGWQVFGNESANRIVGTVGNDVLDGGVGDDTLIGGGGNDDYVVDSTLDVVTEAANQGTDRIFSTVSVSVLAANVENLVLRGGALNANGNALANAIEGNSLANAITGGAGNDLLKGLHGEDTLDGGAGNDTLDGGSGIDVMNGGAGNDLYRVDTGDGIMETATGGIDTVESTMYSTNLAIWTNVEHLTLVDGSASVATTGSGNALNNDIRGNSRNNVLTGGAGDDFLTGGDGTDTMSGGPGSDHYNVDSNSEQVNESPNEGTDTISHQMISSSYDLPVNVEHLTINGWENGVVSGNELDNTIRDNSDQSVSLSGNGGADLLVGGGGNNTLSGGAGTDTLMGGTGNDQYMLSASDLADRIVEAPDQGTTDAVQVSGNGFVDIAYTLPANVEILFMNNMGLQKGTLIGNALGNTLLGDGEGGVFLIDGGAGNDILASDDGDDTLLGGTGNDALNAGIGNDTLLGGTGNDNLQGSEGNDSMTGGLGDDTFNVDSGDGAGTGTTGTAEDQVIELAGQGTDKVVTETSVYVLPAHVENVQVLIPVIAGTFPGPYAYNVTGNAAGNVFDLDGRANVTANGLEGNDLFRASTGLTVGTVPTVPDYSINGGDGTDRVEITLNTDLDLETTGVETIDLTVNEDSLLTTGEFGFDGTANVVIRGDSSLTLPSLPGSTAGGPVYRFENYAGDVVLGVTNAGASDRLDMTLAHAQLGLLTVATATELIRVNVTGGAGLTSALGVAGVNPALESLTVTGTGSLALTDMTSAKGDLVLDNYSGEQLTLGMTNSAGLQIVNIQLTASAVTELDVGGLGDGGDLVAFTANAGSSSRLNFSGQDGTDQYQVLGSGNLVLEDVVADSILALEFTGSLRAQFSAPAVLFVGDSNNARYDVIGSGFGDTFTMGLALDSLDRINGGDGADTVSANVTGHTFETGALQITNVETINLSLDAGADASLDLIDVGRVFGFQADVSGGDANSDLTIVNAPVGSWNAVSFNGNLNIFSTLLTDIFYGFIDVTGGSGNDSIIVPAYGMTLNGRGGNDTMTGGSTYVFDTALDSATNVDTIENFDVDVFGAVLQLDNDIFTALSTPGALSAGNFFSGAGIDATSGADTNDFIKYDTASGSLYYDSNGNASGAMMQFAIVRFGDVASLLTAADLVVID